MFMLSIQTLKIVVLLVGMLVAEYEEYRAEQALYLTPEQMEQLERPAKLEVDFDNAFSPEGE